MFQNMMAALKQNAVARQLATYLGTPSLLDDPLVVRRRFTLAEINAGATLLPSVPGYKYRMVDAYLIAIGGAVGATTTVDIYGVQNGVTVKLLAVAIAALTQSAVVRAAAANATVLADGASFSECDANTAITVGKTGANATTATNVDLVFEFALTPAES